MAPKARCGALEPDALEPDAPELEAPELDAAEPDAGCEPEACWDPEAGWELEVALEPAGTLVPEAPQTEVAFTPGVLFPRWLTLTLFARASTGELVVALIPKDVLLTVRLVPVTLAVTVANLPAPTVPRLYVNGDPDGGVYTRMYASDVRTGNKVRMVVLQPEVIAVMARAVSAVMLCAATNAPRTILSRGPGLREVPYRRERSYAGEPGRPKLAAAARLCGLHARRDAP